MMKELIPALEQIARDAGAVVMDVYGTDFSVERKGDDSPVTEADRRAEALILPALARLTPGIPIIAEEEVAAGRIPQLKSGFWLVDPVDGTKEFLKRNGEFTVNMGLIQDGRPVLGVVFAPALNVMWSGAGPGTACRTDQNGRHSISCRRPPAQGAVVLTSRSHRNPDDLDNWLKQLDQPVLQFAGSSLKLCQVADGQADFYPRFGPTSEWDIAAAHAVVNAAGGEVVTFDGAPMAYGKAPTFLNPNFLVRARD